MVEKYVFNGEKSGCNLLILAAVHGNETAGTIACRRIIAELDAGKIRLSHGRLTLVPVCNSEAYAKDVRQIDENLNRVMKMHNNPQTYEQKLANKICPLIKDNDFTLDLHSTHCQGDVPFAFNDYPEEKSRKLIAALDVGFVLEGWPDIYAENAEIQDFSTEHCAHIYGHGATTLECGYHKAPEAAEIAYSAIRQALAVFGMVKNTTVTAKPKTHILMLGFVIKKRRGQLCKNYKHLDPIRQGEEIARYEDGEVLTAPDDGYILLPNLAAEVGAEWYYFGRKNYSEE